MKGIARVDGQETADYQAVILAFSHLSDAVTNGHSPGGTLTTAAETGAVLLQADYGAVFVRDESSGTIEIAASYQIETPARRTSIPGEAAIRECIERGTPVVVPNISIDKRKGMQTLAKLGAASLLAVPLKINSRCCGALTAMSNTLRAFSPPDIEVLSAVARQAAFAVWKSKLAGNILPNSDKGIISASDLELIEVANRRIQELSIVNKISEAVISTLDLKQLLELAIEQCLFAIGATVGSIMLLDDDAKTLTIKSAKGLSQKVVESASTAVGEGIAGWVAQHGKPVLVHDAHQDPRFRMNRYRDDITSAMSVPLKARGRVIGVINTSTVELGRRFGPAEVEFLSTIANQVALAIDNAQLYERLSRRTTELSSLLQMSEAITSTLELHEILSLLSEKFLAMPNADAGVLLAYDADTGRFRCLDGHGLRERDRESAYLQLALPIAKGALAASGPLCCELSQDSPYMSDVAEIEGLISAVCIPLPAAGSVVGVAGIFSRKPHAFSQAELVMLGAFAKLAGVAIHNALIYKHKYDIAHSLQFQLVPAVPLTMEGLDIGHKFLPAREVGGDYYDIISVATGKVGIVIADVTGNSVPAAMYISMVKHVLRAYAVEDNPPADVLRRLNRFACEATRPDVFISLFYGVFDASDRSFRYVSAGHEPPILVRQNGFVERLQADGLLIGVKPDVEYEEKKIFFDSGSTLVLFTDGVIDSAAVDNRFDASDITEAVADNPLKSAQELADNIYARLMDISAAETHDDVALIVLKVM
ncbi:MAG: SpoIIE family protein phosphatase [Armatimonadota bacterium]